MSAALLEHPITIPPGETSEIVQGVECEFCDARLNVSFEASMKELDDAMFAAGWKYCRDGIQCGIHEVRYV